MKITKEKIRQLIQEELADLQKEMQDMEEGNRERAPRGDKVPVQSPEYAAVRKLFGHILNKAASKDANPADLKPSIEQIQACVDAIKQLPTEEQTKLIDHHVANIKNDLDTITTIRHKDVAKKNVDSVAEELRMMVGKTGTAVADDQPGDKSYVSLAGKEEKPGLRIAVEPRTYAVNENIKVKFK